MHSIIVIVGAFITVVTGIPVMIQLFRNHPRGLFILFFAEMWERFSYYGMRGLLVFYLTQQFLFDDSFSNGEYGAYTTLVYLMPLVGGLLADRYLGTRKAIVFGAILLVAGHMGMAIEGSPAQSSIDYKGVVYDYQLTGRMETRDVKLLVNGRPYAVGAAADGGLAIKDLPVNAPLPSVLPKGSYTTLNTRDQGSINIFYLALSLIIMGVGFLKANISTLVGQLYKEGDPRRDPGFTLYYYGINLGAFWAAILCGALGQTYGWNWGFGAAGVGMLAGLIVFVLGRPLLRGKGEPPNPRLLAQPFLGPINREYLIYGLGIAGIAVAWLLVGQAAWVTASLSVISIAVIGYIGYVMATQCTKVERDRMILASVLIMGSVVFFTLFEQAGSSLNLFTARNVDLSLIDHPTTYMIFGHQFLITTKALHDSMDWAPKMWVDMSIGAAQVQSFNSGFILIFAPVFAALWTWLGRYNRDPNPVLKFGLGLLQVGLGFLVIVFSAGMTDSSFRLPLFVIGLAYLLHTTGELCLSPVGLSQITKLSVAKIVSFMMAVWFLSSAWAETLGAMIAKLAATDTIGGQVLDPRTALETSLGVFKTIGWVAIGVGVLFLVLSPFLKRLAHGINDSSGSSEPPVDGERQTSPVGGWGGRRSL